MHELLKNLAEDFKDGEYAHAYMESHAVSRIAAQIYALRKQRGWSQEELAKQSGVAQETISKIESADFSSLTLKTLHKFSRAFDVDLRIAFDSFSKGILDVVNLQAEKLKVPSRVEDLKVFTGRSLHIDGGGEWQALDVVNLVGVQVVTVISTNDSLSSTIGDWYDIDKNSNSMEAGTC
jgi:transcriptional regulator with XRE-family HTH domain